MYHYYLYLNGIMSSDFKYEFYKNNFVYSLTAKELLENPTFKKEKSLFETFIDYEFLVLQVTESRYHDLFKLACLVTLNNMWAFNYFIYFFKDEVESNYPFSIIMFHHSANSSLAHKITYEQPRTLFHQKELENIKSKMEQLVIFFKNNPEFENKFYNAEYFIINSFYELKTNTNVPKALLYLMSGYESLLNFDKNESINKCIPYRLKKIHGQSKCIKNFKILYNLRSEFIHGNITAYLKTSKKMQPLKLLHKETIELIKTLNYISQRNISITDLDVKS